MGAGLVEIMITFDVCNVERSERRKEVLFRSSEMSRNLKEIIKMVIFAAYAFICISHGPKEFDQALWMAAACGLAWIHGSMFNS